MKPKRTIIFYINASLHVPYSGNKCTAHETHGRKLMQSNGVPSQSQHHHQQEGDNVYLPASRYMEKRCCSASKGDNYILHQCELCVPYSGNKCTAHETHGRKWMRSNGVPSQSQHHQQLPDIWKKVVVQLFSQNARKGQYASRYLCNEMGTGRWEC